ncbi:MAG: hypothetical protein VXZ63_04115, partial [Planctomycetota bacterium]|nr:hypothetical protein [Planctomycetota bacterium]
LVYMMNNVVSVYERNIQVPLNRFPQPQNHPWDIPKFLGTRFCASLRTTTSSPNLKRGIPKCWLKHNHTKSVSRSRSRLMQH